MTAVETVNVSYKFYSSTREEAWEKTSAANGPALTRIVGRADKNSVYAGQEITVDGAAYTVAKVGSIYSAGGEKRQNVYVAPLA